ncbi:MAG: choice-of-anchor J domain-containing protein [Chryseobacterium sp.]|nr:choice-of-anchor J domain-containing protein [Candidatus Chryseobacterium enterohippi]
MKNKYNFQRYLYFVIAVVLLSGCVHDDQYNEPDLTSYNCVSDFKTNITLKQLKEKYTLNNPTHAPFVFPKDNTPNDASDDLYTEGYVTSTDESGNIYKTIYIQDALENPTHGFTISVDAVSTYTQFPQGAKIYIKLNDLAVGVYGGVVQLGEKTGTETSATSVSRIAEKNIPKHLFRSCTTKGKIVPKIMTAAQMVSANDQYIGCLVQINNAEFDRKVLCTEFAPSGTSVDKQIRDASTTTARVVRNSGFASFANQKLPSGNGKFLGIYSKYSSTYQMFINKVTDLEMNNFPRLDGLTSNPCEFSNVGLSQKTIAEVKQLATGALVPITGDFYIKGKVTANDKSGNFYKYVYVEDASGGIRINIDKLDLYNDARFAVGKDIYIKLKNLFVGSVSGEIQLGMPFNGEVGRIPELDIYQYFFDANTLNSSPIPTEKTIKQLSMADVGKFVKIKDLQFINSDLERVYSAANVSNRTLEDCLGNTITLRTSSFADFASNIIEAGKGDVYGIVSVYNGSFQIWIRDLLGADLDGSRCDGSTYVSLPTLYEDTFGATGFSSDWITYNVSGAPVWQTSNVGNGTNYYATMNGFSTGNSTNEDWLISKSVSLVGKTQAAVSFTSDVRYAGNSLQVYATEHYTGDPATTVWVILPATLDSNNLAFGDWVGSGNVSLNSFLGKNVRIGFRYTSTSFSAATWEVDDFKIKGQ